MRYLIDNDVFFAAIYGNHTLHPTARRWLDGAKLSSWGIASETYLAAIRLLMNPIVMKSGHLTAQEAVEAVDMELSGKHPGAIILARTPPDQALLKQAQGHRQIMDFWLIQISRENKCLLATNDSGLAATWPDLTLRIS